MFLDEMLKIGDDSTSHRSSLRPVNQSKALKLLVQLDLIQCDSALEGTIRLLTKHVSLIKPETLEPE